MVAIIMMLAVAWSIFVVVVNEGINHVRSEGSLMFASIFLPLSRINEATEDDSGLSTYIKYAK